MKHKASLCLLILVAFLYGSCKRDLKEEYVYCSKCGGDGWDYGTCKMCGGHGQLKTINSTLWPPKIEDEITPTPPPPEPEWIEEWYDDPVCHGSGNCSVCDGTGKWDIGGIIYMCTGCNGTGVCTYCGGKGQCPITRQVYR